jgi:hypothetical protein
MKVKLQAQLWDAIEFGDAEFHEGWLALDTLLASVPSEMVASLADKPTAKDAWDFIAATRVDLMFRPGEDIDDFALRLSGLVQHGDGDIDEQKAVEKYLRIVPKKYTQIALSMETLLDLSTLSIEEVTTRKRFLPTPSPPTASCYSPRSSGSLARRRRRSRRARFRLRIVTDNNAIRAVTAAPAAVAVEKGVVVVVVGNARRPVATLVLPQLWSSRPLGQGLQGAAHMAQAEEEESSLFLAHASPVLWPKEEASEGEALTSPHTHSTPLLTSSALLHIDEPRAQAFLSDGSDDHKLKGWYLDSGATHHMTGCVGHFAHLDRSVRGSIKFDDEPAVEICSIRSVVFVAKTTKHKLLHGVYYIPALRNSIISLGQLNEGGSRV